MTDTGQREREEVVPPIPPAYPIGSARQPLLIPEHDEPLSDDPARRWELVVRVIVTSALVLALAIAAVAVALRFGWT